MRLIHTLFAVCLVCTLRLSGQTFVPAPAALLEQEVDFLQANEAFIYFQNLSPDTLHLRWRVIESSVPAGWDIDLCDYGACYIGIPPNGTMNPVYDTIQAYLKLVVQPDNHPGAAWLWFRVSEVDNPANAQDVYFSLHTPGTVAAPVPATPELLSLFPNPTTGAIWLNNPGNRNRDIRLYDASGRLHGQTAVPPGQSSVNVSFLPAGAYWIVSGTERQLFFKQ